MSRVRSRDTKPELTVRRVVWSLGFRYRLHGKLPGKPDLVFRARKKVIFVHGCFWHQHKSCHHYRMPRTNLQFWLPKLRENAKRDRSNQILLRKMGWTSLVIWECELKHKRLAERIITFLE
jgi:DNA mismatch endonuclease, patch repair protein